MIFSRLLKNRLTTKLFILFIILQTSACGTEELLTAVEPDTGSNTIDVTGANTNISDETSAHTDIKLSWVAPTQREDNTGISLSEIAGFKVYYGTVQGLYPGNVIINDGSAVDYTFTSLPMDNTYYFVITTLDTEGRESQHSPEVVTSI